jgi:hypothetical protein
MSWLGNVLKFENFNLANQWDKLKKNPERPFIGAMDKGGSLAWNKIYDLAGINKRYEPMTDWYGGASDDSYAKAQNAGINTGPGRSMHNVAKAITSAYVGGYGASQLGAGAGGATGATESGVINPATGLDWSATGSGYAGNGGYVSGGMGTGSAVGGVSGGEAGDVWSSWSPSGSSASGNPSTLSPSSSNPSAYTDPYAAQDVMQQARDTSVASGEAGAWDNPAVPASNSSGGSMFNKQMLARSLMNMGGGGQPQRQEELKIYESQDPFVRTEQALPIQDAGALAKALRNPYA